jgi:hypothetical protein
LPIYLDDMTVFDRLTDVFGQCTFL